MMHQEYQLISHPEPPQLASPTAFIIGRNHNFGTPPMLQGSPQNFQGMLPQPPSYPNYQIMQQNGGGYYQQSQQPSSPIVAHQTTTIVAGGTPMNGYQPIPLPEITATFQPQQISLQSIPQMPQFPLFQQSSPARQINTLPQYPQLPQLPQIPQSPLRLYNPQSHPYSLSGSKIILSPSSNTLTNSPGGRLLYSPGGQALRYRQPHILPPRIPQQRFIPTYQSPYRQLPIATAIPSELPPAYRHSPMAEYLPPIPIQPVVAQPRHPQLYSPGHMVYAAPQYMPPQYVPQMNMQQPHFAMPPPPPPPMMGEFNPNLPYPQEQVIEVEEVPFC